MSTHTRFHVLLLGAACTLLLGLLVMVSDAAASDTDGPEVDDDYWVELCCVCPSGWFPSTYTPDGAPDECLPYDPCFNGETTTFTLMPCNPFIDEDEEDAEEEEIIFVLDPATRSYEPAAAPSFGDRIEQWFRTATLERLEQLGRRTS